MHLEDTYLLNASQTNVWEFVSDPQKFAHCLPGMQSLEVKDPTRFGVVVKVGIALIRGKMKFDFTAGEKEPPSHTRFQGEGRGAGISIKLTLDVKLKEKSPNETELAWVADATLGGMLGEMAGSLVENSAKDFAQQFFECVKKELG